MVFSAYLAEWPDFMAYLRAQQQERWRPSAPFHHKVKVLVQVKCTIPCSRQRKPSLYNPSDVFGTEKEAEVLPYDFGYQPLPQQGQLQTNGVEGDFRESLFPDCYRSSRATRLDHWSGSNRVLRNSALPTTYRVQGVSLWRQRVIRTVLLIVLIHISIHPKYWAIN